MAFTHRVKLDIGKIIDNTLTDDGRRLDRATAIEWLKGIGFTALGDAWLCDEGALRRLHGDEVVSVERIDGQ